MDYLLSREKTSIDVRKPSRARSILVNCKISTDDLHTVFGQRDISSVTCGHDVEMHYSVFNERAPMREALFL